LAINDGVRVQGIDRFVSHHLDHIFEIGYRKNPISQVKWAISQNERRRRAFHDEGKKEPVDGPSPVSANLSIPQCSMCGPGERLSTSYTARLAVTLAF